MAEKSIVIVHAGTNDLGWFPPETQLQFVRRAIINAGRFAVNLLRMVRRKPQRRYISAPERESMLLAVEQYAAALREKGESVFINRDIFGK